MLSDSFQQHISMFHHLTTITATGGEIIVDKNHKNGTNRTYTEEFRTTGLVITARDTAKINKAITAKVRDGCDCEVSRNA